MEVSGWGSGKNITNPSSDVLLETKAAVSDFADCKKYFDSEMKEETIFEGMFCTDDSMKDSSACVVSIIN